MKRNKKLDETKFTNLYKMQQEKLNENCLSWDQPSKAVFKSPNHAES